MEKDLEADLVSAASHVAINTRRPSPRSIHHTGRSGQYTPVWFGGGR